MKTYHVPAQPAVSLEDLPEGLQLDIDNFREALAEDGLIRDEQRILLSMAMAHTIEGLLSVGDKTGIFRQRVTEDHFETVVIGLAMTRVLGYFSIDGDNHARPELADAHEVLSYDKVVIGGKEYDTRLAVEAVKHIMHDQRGKTDNLYQLFYGNHSKDKHFNCFVLAEAILKSADRVVSTILPKAQVALDAVSAMEEDTAKQ